MNESPKPLQTIPTQNRLLTAENFLRLSEVPPEVEWFTNLTNKATRRAYENAIKDFMQFIGVVRQEEFRDVTRAHVIAWRDNLMRRQHDLRHSLSALASLFDYLCEKNAVTHYPVKGVKRPKNDSQEGRTLALGDHQSRKQLDAPDGDSLRTKRDRAILATLLYHALRRDELCKLNVKDFKHERRGEPHLKVSGKGGKIGYVPLHPAASRLVYEYIEMGGHCADKTGSLFRLVSNNTHGEGKGITRDGIYKIVRAYSGKLGFEIGAHSLGATTATNALDHQTDIAKVQEWLEHTNIATTRIYDHRKTRPEDSPTFKVNY